MSDTGPPGAATPTQTTNPDPAFPGRPGFVGRLKHLRGSIAGLVDRLKRLRRPIVAIAAVGAVLSGLFGYWNVYRSVNDSPAPPAPKRAEAPPWSIAVLPFAVVGGKADEDLLAQTLTQDVTAALGRSGRYLRVRSYSTVSDYKGKHADDRAAGRDLNVRYLAEGELRRDGDRLVVNTLLIDAEQARQVWNDRLETSDKQLAADRYAVIGALAKRIKLTVVDLETRRASEQSDAKADAATLQLRGDVLLDGSLNGVREARKLYEQSLRLDPRSVSTLTSLSWSSQDLIDLDPQADRDRLIGEMEDFSSRAVAIDRSDPRAWNARSIALSRQYRWNEALEALDETLRIDPGRSSVYEDRALIMIWMGRPQEAFAELDKEIALDPREADDGNALRIRCRAHLALGRYDDAIKLCERAAGLVSNVYTIHVYLTVVYAEKGEITKAAAAKARLLTMQPGYTIARLRALRLSDAPAYWQQLETYIIPGLRKAGIPEQ